MEKENPDFEALFNEHHERVFRLILRMVHHQEDAEDLTQQVFLKGYKNWEEFRGESRASTWVYRIAMNLAVDYIRNGRYRARYEERSQSTKESDSQIDKAADPSPHQEDQLIREEMHLAVREAIAQLDDIYRDTLILREFEGLSYQEIAALLDITVKAVSVRLARAKDQLEEKLEKFI